MNNYYLKLGNKLRSSDITVFSKTVSEWSGANLGISESPDESFITRPGPAGRCGEV